MTLNEYQKLAARTIPYNRSQTDCLINGALGLTGEAGESVEHVKKYLYHNKPLDAGELILELGDVMYYIAEITGALGATLEEVAQANIDKLKKRYPDGFRVETNS